MERFALQAGQIKSKSTTRYSYGPPTPCPFKKHCKTRSGINFSLFRQNSNYSMNKQKETITKNKRNTSNALAGITNTISNLTVVA